MIQWLEEGQRKSLTIGLMNSIEPETAKQVRAYVDQLIASRDLNMTPRPDLVTWAMDSILRPRLEELRLLPRAREVPQLPIRKLADEWLAEVEQTVGSATYWTYSRSVDKFTLHLGKYLPAELEEKHAKDFRRHLANGHAEQTVRLHCRHLRRFLRWCQNKGLCQHNAASAVPTNVRGNRENRVEVPRAAIDTLLPTLTQEWRVFVALGRYGGLRLPSEMRPLRWTDVLWDQGRFIVRASKTGEVRQVPLFPELRAELEPMIPTDEPYVLPNIRVITGAGSILRKYVEAAGLQPWPRICHNMRATRESELMREYPIHVVCQWLGNKPSVALEHYAMATANDYEMAARQVLADNGLPNDVSDQACASAEVVGS